MRGARRGGSWEGAEHVLQGTGDVGPLRGKVGVTPRLSGSESDHPILRLQGRGRPWPPACAQCTHSGQAASLWLHGPDSAAVCRAAGLPRVEPQARCLRPGGNRAAGRVAPGVLGSVPLPCSLSCFDQEKGQTTRLFWENQHNFSIILKPAKSENLSFMCPCRKFSPSQK